MLSRVENSIGYFLHALGIGDKKARVRCTMSSEERLTIRAATESNLLERKLTKKQTIPLPKLTETEVNWKRVDNVSRALGCISFPGLLTLINTTGSFSFGINTALLNTSANYIASDFGWCDYEGYTDPHVGRDGGAPVYFQRSKSPSSFKVAIALNGTRL
eukprot:Blabericola_migrator_1__4117@NODE_2254_length_3048_cov_129_054344_g682_i1_p3_GENE_NODE_2254_length_3048_cov_129_054344_g682_i1NODE_2254_length_3048_cov_129_054344_g682_i1_p3_ORF_typecomplete_len160_score14_02_NODE_2254_length_3048_cov_129_054344_g682_i115722051